MTVSDINELVKEINGEFHGMKKLAIIHNFVRYVSP